ncbi:MAG: transglutaminase family protein [Cyclobacteriaceae bacterium]
MPTKIVVDHHTRYDYDRHTKLSPQLVRLHPVPHFNRPILEYQLDIKPGDHTVKWQKDSYGNTIASVTLHGKVNHFEVNVKIITEVSSVRPKDALELSLESMVLRHPFNYDESEIGQLTPYLKITEDDNHLSNFIGKLKEGNSTRAIELVEKVNRLIYNSIQYRIRMKPGVQSCEETLLTASGSCRDLAWLAVQTLRHLGFAARFVSGYLVQLNSNDESSSKPLVEDFTDLHAWTEVYLPEVGWIGIDPTTGTFETEGYIPLACTPTPKEAAPIFGTFETAEASLYFENKVKRIA